MTNSTLPVVRYSRHPRGVRSAAAMNRAVDHAAEIGRLIEECAALREELGRQIDARARAIARHQLALLHQARTLRRVK